MAGFFNKDAGPQRAATYIAFGIALAYILFHFPVTLLFGLLIAAGAYALNDPHGAASIANRMC